MKNPTDIRKDIFLIDIPMQIKAEILKTSFLKLMVDNIKSSGFFCNKQNTFSIIPSFCNNVRNCLRFTRSRRTL